MLELRDRWKQQGSWRILVTHHFVDKDIEF